MADASTIDLLTHTRHVERLFVIGAGFSLSVSKTFPLTRDLLEHLYDEDPSLCDELERLSSFFAPSLRIRAAANVPDIMSILTVLEAYRQVIGPAGPVGDEISRAQTRVLYAASTLLYRLSQSADDALLKAFVSRLDPERDAILTTNWDVLAERGLHDAGIPFQYDVLPSMSGLDRPEGFLLLKPQGSVTWSRMTPVPGLSTPVLNVAPVAPLTKWTLSERIGAPPAFASPGAVASDPAIIPPGFIGENRSTELDWSGYLLRAATCAATNARQIVVIGYSLPPDDHHILSALSIGVPQDTHGDGVDVFVVDPSQATFQQWRTAFHGLATRSTTAVRVRHWAPTLDVALARKGGPW